MKSTRLSPLSGNRLSLASKLFRIPFFVSIFAAGGLMGQMATAPGKVNPAPAAKETVLMEKVMTDLPHYGESPAVVVLPESKPITAETTEVVRLVPYVVVGEKGRKLSEQELLTKKAYAARILNEYDHSVFSLFQHRETKRLQDMTSLRSYADTLMLAGDAEGSNAIKQESDRLFLRSHDPESNAVDLLFNPRIR